MEKYSVIILTLFGVLFILICFFQNQLSSVNGPVFYFNEPDQRPTETPSLLIKLFQYERLIVHQKFNPCDRQYVLNNICDDQVQKTVYYAMNGECVQGYETICQDVNVLESKEECENKCLEGRIRVKRSDPKSRRPSCGARSPMC